MKEALSDGDDAVGEQLGILGGGIVTGVDLGLDVVADPCGQPRAETAVDPGQELEAGLALVLEEGVDAVVVAEVGEEVHADRLNARQPGLCPMALEHMVGDRVGLCPDCVGQEALAIARPAIEGGAGHAEVGGEGDHVDAPAGANEFSRTLERSGRRRARFDAIGALHGLLVGQGRSVKAVLHIAKNIGSVRRDAMGRLLSGETFDSICLICDDARRTSLSRLGESLMTARIAPCLTRRFLNFVLLAAVIAAAALCPTSASAAPYAFQPIAIQRINLPSIVKSAGWPVFTHDGRHLLFFSTGSNTAGGSTGPGAKAELWITSLRGGHAHCLSCGLANDPTSQGEGEITPFPDGKRVFFGSFFQPGSSAYGVLECSPSVADCKAARVLPVDFSAAEPKTIPPGGAVSSPQLNTGGAYGAKLAQDGTHVGFSDIRSDSIETMVIGKLTRSGSTYEVTDPRVINPSSPTSSTDSNVDAWSDSGALYEFKTFTHGGADATYVESGGPALLNADVWSVNLKTGKRTRLTANPDYDEDNAVSPNGELLALWSNRTMHMVDWYSGLLPVRDFIDTPAALMSLSLSSSNKRCHGPIWVLPSSGDHGAALVGQPIVDYRVPHVFVTNNLTGWPQWSPNGTMLALNTTNNRAGPGYPAHAPFLLVAHFSALKPTRPLRVVNSQPGSWAVAPTAYHPVFGYAGTRTFNGRGGGTVTVDYGLGSGVLSGGVV